MDILHGVLDILRYFAWKQDIPEYFAWSIKHPRIFCIKYQTSQNILDGVPNIPGYLACSANQPAQKIRWPILAPILHKEGTQKAAVFPTFLLGAEDKSLTKRKCTVNCRPINHE